METARELIRGETHARAREAKENATGSIQNGLRILNIYFWTHGLGLESVFGPHCCSPTVLTSASALLAVFFEASRAYTLYAVYARRRVSGSITLTSSAAMFSVCTLSVLQRFLLHCRRRSMEAAVRRLVRIRYGLSGSGSRADFKTVVIVAVLASDAFAVAILLVLYYTLATDSHFNLITDSDPLVAEVMMLVGDFCFIWGDVGQCAALYFGCICLILKENFRRLTKMSRRSRSKEGAVKMYNKVLAATKTVNAAFSGVLVAAIAESLALAFYETYTIAFLERHSTSDLLYRTLASMYNYLRVVIICFSASSVTNSALDLKYAIQEMPDRVCCSKHVTYVQRLNEMFPGFTVLDSITLDKSFILSVSGILLTYGVMIATFSVASK